MTKELYIKWERNWFGGEYVVYKKHWLVDQQVFEASTLTECESFVKKVEEGRIRA